MSIQKNAIIILNSQPHLWLKQWVFALVVNKMEYDINTLRRYNYDKWDIRCEANFLGVVVSKWIIYTHEILIIHKANRCIIFSNALYRWPLKLV